MSAYYVLLLIITDTALGTMNTVQFGGYWNSARCQEARPLVMYRPRNTLKVEALCVRVNQPVKRR